MSTKISNLPAATIPIAAADLLPIVDTSAAITKSVRTDQSLIYNKISIPTGEILTLNGTPVELIAAPGAGKIILPKYYVYSLTWNSVAYDTNTNLQWLYDTGTAFSPTDQSILEDTQDFIVLKSFVTAVTTEGVLQNKKLSITVQTGNPANGNSVLDVYIWYQILTL